jgi:putative tricarboxylic transport membrane protein
MGVFDSLMLGFSVALDPTNLLFCFVGVLCGTLVGILPGLGPSATIAILIPVTFGMNPTTAMIMLAGVYYGAKYGGALTSILINTPGESSSVMTCLDGYQMAVKGEAGRALGLAAISSFIGGTFSVLVLMLIAPPLAELAISFGPPEYFALMLLGLVMVIFLGGATFVKASISCIFGLLLGTVGVDPLHGQPRLTFDQIRLFDGLEFVIVAMGLFAIAEVLVNAESTHEAGIVKGKLVGLFPRLSDLLKCKFTFLRSTVLGFFIGVLPGAGSTIATFLAYSVEKSVSKDRAEFGHGAVQGVAAPETADNSATGGEMVPLLTLGIPGSGSTAVMLGAMMTYGVRPGPLLFEQQPEFVWAIIASMYVGNVMLLIMNLPLVPVFASALRIRYTILYPTILLVCAVGAYSLNGSMFDVGLLVMFGLIGYAMRKTGFPAAPVVLALVLGPMIERALSQSLSMSQGDLTILIERPISGSLIALITLIVIGAIFGALRRRGKPANAAAS